MQTNGSGVFRLGDLCEITVGYVGPMAKEYVPIGIPLLRSLNIKPYRLDLSELKYISNSFHSKISKSSLNEGDVVIVRTGQPGTACVIPTDIGPLNCSDLVIVRPDKNKVNPHYLAFYFNSMAKNYVGNQLVGAIQQHFNIGSAKEMLINLPPISIQKEIANTLHNLNRKIELNNRITAELEAMAKLLYDYWFVQFDFPISKEQAKAMGNPNLECKPYKASGGKMVWSEELKRAVPEGWEVGAVNDLGEIVGGSTPSTQDPSNFDRSGTPWITPKDLSLNTGNKFITKGELCVTTEGIKNASLKIMPPGTILLSSRAPIGYMAIARENTTSNQGFKNIVPTKGYSSEVLYYLVRNLLPVIEQNASGSTFKEISGSVLKAIKLVLPTKALSVKLTTILQPIFAKQDILEQENKKLAELRDWLLPMLMSGQVKLKDVQNQLSMAAEQESSYA